MNDTVVFSPRFERMFAEGTRSREQAERDTRALLALRAIPRVPEAIKAPVARDRWRKQAKQQWLQELDGLLTDHADPEAWISLTKPSSFLHRMIEKQYTFALDRLLQHGADPNSCDQRGNSCLWKAAAYRYSAICNKLLDWGADATMTPPNSSRTILSLAVSVEKKKENKELSRFVRRLLWDEMVPLPREQDPEKHLLNITPKASIRDILLNAGIEMPQAKAKQYRPAQSGKKWKKAKQYARNGQQFYERFCDAPDTIAWTDAMLARLCNAGRMRDVLMHSYYQDQPEQALGLIDRLPPCVQLNFQVERTAFEARLEPDSLVSAANLMQMDSARPQSLIKS